MKAVSEEVDFKPQNCKNNDSLQISPPVTRSRNKQCRKKPIVENVSNNSHITNYFRVVSSINCFDKREYQEKCEHPSVKECYDGIELDKNHFKFDLADIGDIIYTENPDQKKNILNNIFKKEYCTVLSKKEKNNADVKCLVNGVNNTSDSHINGTLDAVLETKEIKQEENVSNVRLSPRKHASTLQRCVTIKENIKTPHRISLYENLDDALSTATQVSFRPYKRHRKRLNSKIANPNLNDTNLNKTVTEPNSRVKKNGLVCDKKDDSGNIQNAKREKYSKSNDNVKSDNHKLTEYFPVRRSERKTKKEVMEEKKRDLEIAIKEQREEGLEVASFEGKGRGIIALRKFHRGEFVVEYAGDLVDIVEARKREAYYAQDQTAGCYMYYFRHSDQHYCIDATAETGRLGRLVNHSRNGNLITKSVFLESRPHLVLIANQDILPGEEVTYDYGDRSKESLQHHPWLAL